jgi:Domain of unknown function (DUF222)/HNH endonuclease
MFDRVNRAIRDLKAAVADLDPDVLESRSAVALVEKFSEAERVAAAGKALAAKRVAESGAWKPSGARTAAHWMATATGTSVGSALGVLETAARLSDLPRTDKAVRAGKLSEAQTKEIASAAAAAPSSEGELLKVAATEGMATLKERCARVKAAAASDESEKYARIYRRRRLRHWTDPEGAFRLEALLTPDCGARVMAALEPYRERIFADARKQGRREPYEAYGADALVEMATDKSAGTDQKNPTAFVHVFVDHKALVRGHTANGEVCEIAGVGPVPIATAEALAADAYLQVLVTNGTDISAVSSKSRTISPRLRAAVIARDTKCVVPGCEVRHHLQIDHIKPRHQKGRNELANLQRLCPYHHYLKTHKGYYTKGPPGARTWHPPGETQTHAGARRE